MERNRNGFQRMLGRILLLALAGALCLGVPAGAAKVKTSVRVMAVGKQFTVKKYKRVKTSKKSVVKVTKSGKKYKIKARKAGTATLTYYNKKGKATKKEYVLVTARNTLKYDASFCSLKVGQTKTVKATCKYGVVQYRSDDEKVAKVENSSGKITAIAPGVCTIRVKALYRGKTVMEWKKSVKVIGIGAAGGGTSSQKKVTCENCGGRGWQECDFCNGDGCSNDWKCVWGERACFDCDGRGWDYEDPWDTDSSGGTGGSGTTGGGTGTGGTGTTGGGTGSGNTDTNTGTDTDSSDGNTFVCPPAFCDVFPHYETANSKAYQRVRYLNYAYTSLAEEDLKEYIALLVNQYGYSVVWENDSYILFDCTDKNLETLKGLPSYYKDVVSENGLDCRLAIYRDLMGSYGNFIYVYYSPSILERYYVPESTDSGSGSGSSGDSSGGSSSEEQKCIRCDGTGRRDCLTCGGDGYVVDKIGTRACPNVQCGGGKVWCSTCGGDGKV